MNSMSAKTFIDTSVLIYAHDKDAGAKHQIAKTVLRDLWSERTGLLSVQVLQEFYVNVTRKISSPLSKDLARLVVSSYAIWCTETTPAEIASAFRIEDESRIGCWDCHRESVCGHPLRPPENGCCFGSNPVSTGRSGAP